ncbi:hypothetical protein MNBD_GAMMA09-2706 [hydrothermal vent metagenome]|uniref:DUF3135 domain-containing protein n=1 Tax=hydrothermal vent metagenome TaxID=652676 RepID=A0A3B0XYV4_9ZZZZ
MSFDLPDFNYLKTLAEENPEELDFLCDFYSRQIIDNAPEKYQRRLCGLYFQIESSRRLSKNPLHSCISLSRMMMNSFVDLQNALTDMYDLNNNTHTQSKNEPLDKKQSNNVVCMTTREKPEYSSS